MFNRRRAAIAVMVAAIVTSAAIAPAGRASDGPASPGLEAEVRRLLTDLGSPTRAARSAAEARLLELGPPVLPHLPPPELLPTVSVRETVDRIRRDLERRHARESVQASRVTLQGTRPLSEWLAEIEKQSRNRLDVGGLPPMLTSRPLAVDLAAREFWPALDELATRAGFVFAPDPIRRGLILTPALAPSAVAPPLVVGYAGPFRLTARPAEIVPIGAAREAPVDASLRRIARVNLSVQAEPRLRPLFLQFSTAGIAATSSALGALKPFSPEASYELPVGDAGGTSRLQLDYVLPEGAARGTLDLAGTFRMMTAADSAAIRFDDVAAKADGKDLGIDRRRGGVTVSLLRARRERTPAGRNELRVRVTVAWDSGGPAFESHRSWILHNEVYLEAAGGKRLPLNGGYETTLQADGAVGMEYRFVDLADPLPEMAFVYVAPTLIIDVPVEFALKSVPVETNR